jgi:hypothetical protein
MNSGQNRHGTGSGSCRPWQSVLLLAGIGLALGCSLGRAAFPQEGADNYTGHPRIIVISDIGNEPDDQMSLVRLLLYSNEIDIEALIAGTSTWQKAIVHPETMHALIQAYGQVRANLLQHAKGWPDAKDLNLRVFSGQRKYGMAGTAHVILAVTDEGLPRLTSYRRIILNVLPAGGRDIK